MIPTEKLAPYLAHGLQFYGGGDAWTMTALFDGGGVVCNNGRHENVLHHSQVGTEYKPILRSFSEYTNGCDLQKQYESEVPQAWTATHELSALHSFQESAFFFKHKFDVFGLIAEGLAEDATKLGV